MKVLVIAEKEAYVEHFLSAFTEKGFEAKFLPLTQINLVSKHRLALIKALKEKIPRYDAVFLHSRLNLAPFIEPLLDELLTQNIYTNCRPGSYYICSSEPYEFVALTMGHVPTINTVTVGTAKGIEQMAKKIKYPVLAKSFKGTEAQQALVVNDGKELGLFAKSIRGEVDGFILREYIDADVVSCAVVGDKVFAVKRRIKDRVVEDIKDAMVYKPTDTESDAAIKAALVCGYDIAQVDMVGGKVFNVNPVVKWKTFSRLTSANLETHVAQFYAEKVRHFGAKKTVVDEIRYLGDAFSKTVFGRLFK